LILEEAQAISSSKLAIQTQPNGSIALSIAGMATSTRSLANCQAVRSLPRLFWQMKLLLAI
jgi:hypothetical protein